MESHRTGPTTARLELRQMSPDDAEAFFRVQTDPDVMRYTHETPPGSVEELRSMIAAHPDFEQYGYGRWGCYLRSTGELIGFCGLKREPECGVTDLGYRFLPEHWGRGYGTEGGIASLRYGFEVIGLDRIDGFVLRENVGSIRVLERVGMEPIGTVIFDGIEALRYSAVREGWAPAVP